MGRDLQESEHRTVAPTAVAVRPPVSPAAGTPLRTDLRRTVRIGAAVIILFFAVGGGWASTMPLAGAAIAPGVVSPEGSRRTVQHLEGGIIREIRVAEGDEVSRGEILLVLDDISAQAETETLASRLYVLAAKEARLRAERDGTKGVAFSHPALSDTRNSDVRAAIGQQLSEFESRRSSDASREAILRQRIAQLRDQIAGYRKQLESIRRQNELIREELRDVEGLYRQGYERKARVLALKRTEAELLGTEGDLLSRVAAAEEAIGETRLQAANLSIQRREDADQELTETQAQRLEIEKQIGESRDRLARTVIAAPTDGTVMDLRFKTAGGVVRPGEPVLDIVPDNEDLVIEAKVQPRDIDEVHAGLPAYVVFPSFPQRSLHKIPGEVTQISADAFQDERSGESYFTARVRIDHAVLAEEAPQIELTPGLPAEVYIKTTERTLLAYLVQPFSQVVERSFREY